MVCWYRKTWGMRVSFCIFFLRLRLLDETLKRRRSFLSDQSTYQHKSYFFYRTWRSYPQSWKFSHRTTCHQSTVWDNWTKSYDHHQIPEYVTITNTLSRCSVQCRSWSLPFRTICIHGPQSSMKWLEGDGWFVICKLDTRWLTVARFRLKLDWKASRMIS